MANYYIYLISSLPLLLFGMKPPFTFERFLILSDGLIPEEDVTVIKNSSIFGEYDYTVKQPTLKKWVEYDTALRNELVRLRAARKHLEPAKYLREDIYVDSSIPHIALAALRNPSILEGERFLDLERWKFLDELSMGHYFDLDFLIIYALKLLILERWEAIRSPDKSKLLEDVLLKTKTSEKA